MTKKERDTLSSLLANYMETRLVRDWDKWIKAFMSAPLTAGELAKIREQAREIIESRQSPVLRAMK